MGLPGESIDRCAARELLEEAGLRLPVIPVPTGDPNWHVYAAEAPADATVTLSAEHDRFEWLPAGEAVARCRPAIVAEQLRTVARGRA